MKVVVLGGYGHYGRYIARKLAERNIVTTLVIAGRSFEKAQAQAERLGDKAVALRVDLFGEPKVPDALRGANLIVNAAGPDHLTAVPGLRLAIAAGADYCDLNLSWRATEQALAMNRDAQGAGITAITGVGAFPGLFSLLAMHGVGRFDRVTALRMGYCMSVQAAFGDPKSGAIAHTSGQEIGAALAAIIHGFSGAPPASSSKAATSTCRPSGRPTRFRSWVAAPSKFTPRARPSQSPCRRAFPA